MHMRVSAEQFAFHDDRLLHRPSGSTFWIGRNGEVCCHTGDCQLPTGDDYKLEDLKDHAWQILRSQSPRQTSQP